MGIGAVITAIAAVIGIVNGIIEFGKHVDEYIRQPSAEAQQRVENDLFRLRGQGTEIIALCAKIQSALSELGEQIFRDRLADVLGDMDTALLDLDTWRREGGDVPRALALSGSAGALADVVRYGQENVHPKPALGFVLCELLMSRLYVLKELDPGFARSGPQRQAISQAAELLISAAVDIENSIREASIIDVEVKHWQDREPGNESVSETWAVANYRSLAGAVSFHDETRHFGPREASDAQIFNKAVNELRNRAEAQRQVGLIDDYEQAGATKFRRTAKVAEDGLKLSELMLFASAVGRTPTTIEQAVYVAKRQRESAVEALTFFIDRTGDDAYKMVIDQLASDRREFGSDDPPDAAEIVEKVSVIFGRRAALGLAVGALVDDGSDSRRDLY